MADLGRQGSALLLSFKLAQASLLLSRPQVHAACLEMGPLQLDAGLCRLGLADSTGRSRGDLLAAWDGSEWPVAGAAVIEIGATFLTVKLLVPMSGMEQAVPKVD